MNRLTERLRPLQRFTRTRFVPDPRHPYITRRTTFGLILLYTQILLYTHLTLTHLLSLRSTIGVSMAPTLAPQNDTVLISRLHRRGKNIRVGDMVEFSHPLLENEAMVKRIVGLEGDFVLAGTPGGGNDEAMIQVPAGHCWVNGDNLLHSRDSRVFGAVPMALIKGKVVARVWPWGRRRWFENTLEEVEDVD